MGLASSGSIVLRLMELMSGSSRLGSSPVKLCCDGYTCQHLSRQVNKNYLTLQNQGPQRLNLTISSYSLTSEQ